MFKDLGKISKDKDWFHDYSTDSFLLSIVKPNHTSYFTRIMHYQRVSVYISSTSEEDSISKLLGFFVWRFVLQCTLASVLSFSILLCH